jgi:transposase
MLTSSHPLVTALLPALPGLHAESLDLDDQRLTIGLAATSRAAACPLCTTLATSIHSCYTRTVADLPCPGRIVRLQLTVRKFFCKQATCSRRIFTERLVGLVMPWARRTARCASVLRVVALALGSRPAALYGAKSSSIHRLAVRQHPGSSRG